MQLAATDDVREIIPRCEKHPDLQMLGNMVWVIANTGLPNREFASLRKLDIDPIHVLLASTCVCCLFVRGRMLDYIIRKLKIVAP